MALLLLQLSIMFHDALRLFELAAEAEADRMLLLVLSLDRRGGRFQQVHRRLLPKHDLI